MVYSTPKMTLVTMMAAMTDLGKSTVRSRVAMQIRATTPTTRFTMAVCPLAPRPIMALGPAAEEGKPPTKEFMRLAAPTAKVS